MKIKSMAVREGREIVAPELSGEAAVNALKSLKPAQISDLEMRERRRMLVEPLDLSGLNNLSLLESLSNNADEADALALESSSRSLRDVQSQIGALQHWLIAKDYDKAMYHLDGILVSDPELGQTLFPGIVPLLEGSQAAASFAKVLNRNPPWRRDLFTWLYANDRNDQVTFKVLTEIRKQGGSVTDAETTEYLRKLMAAKNYDRAYFVWLDSLDQTSLRKVGNVFDGSFDLEPKNQYFDWSLFHMPNAEIGIVAQGESEKNRALRMSFYNTTEKFDHLSQYLRIRSGSYRFSAQYSASNYKVPGGVKFSITCADSGALLGESAPIKESSAWTSIAFDFSVPAETCQTQLLRLRSASPAVLDAPLSGELLFDSFEIRETGTQ